MILRIRGSGDSRGFTLVELLTVLAVMGILVALLVPALSMIQGAAELTRQRAQFHSIEIGLEAFKTDFGEYPPSAAEFTEMPSVYCGAQVLAEAMIGRDGFGYHPDSELKADGTDITGAPLYKPDIDGVLTAPEIEANLKSRKGPYLELEVANPVKLNNIFANTDTLDGDTFVLADKFGAVKRAGLGSRMGMPILYYSADTLKFEHNSTSWNSIEANNESIYNFAHNMTLVNLAPPFSDPGSYHEMEDPEDFYEITRNPTFTTSARPYRAESFILISAGPDGEYGTSDDVFNFEKE
jgi:prepilin-type N-terminal cleavage/methylation domain-containing protein